MDEGPGSKQGIADGLRRLLDQRDEERCDGGSQNAVLTHNGDRHVVGVINLSTSGAMIRFRGELIQGAEVQLQLLDHGTVTGQVRWIRDGRVGVSFATPVNVAEDQE